MSIFVKAAITTILVTIIAGCGGAANKEKTALDNNDVVVSEQPKSDKRYSVVTTGTADPFSIKNEQGKMSGIDIDILKEIGKLEGFEVEFFERSWSDVLSSIDTKEYDIAVNGINYSSERDSKYGLTQTYFYNPEALMYKTEVIAKQPRTSADLLGLTVAVMRGAQLDTTLSTIDGIKVQRESNLFTAYKALVQDRVQVVAYDMAVMQSLLKKHNDTTMTIVPYGETTDKSAYNVFVVHKDNQELLKKLNSGIDKLSKSGRIDEIRKKYVGE